MLSSIDDTTNKKLLLVIFVAGLCIDYFSAYKIWAAVASPELIIQNLGNYGQHAELLDLEVLLADLRQLLGPMLIIFLLIDSCAYYFLLKYKNWARKYVLSIAVFYLASSLVAFDWLSCLYGVFTTLFLVSQARLFVEKKV